jgi:hypothetical protein
MVTLLFAVLTVAGSWYAWRNNPMYSRRRTLYYLLAIGLSIAAAICVFIAIIHFTENRSKEIQMTAVFTAVFFVTIALIWIIVTVTNPKIQAIPKGTRLATFHRRRLIPWLKRALWTLAILAVVAIVPWSGTGFNWIQFVALFIGAWVLGLGGIMLAVGYIAGRNLDRALTAVEANAWIHWSYTPAEWSSWIDIQVARCQAAVKPANPRKQIRVTLGIAALILVSCFFAFKDARGLGLGVALGMCGILAAIFLLAARSDKAAPARMRRKLSSAEPAVWIAPDGLYANGEYNPWLSTGIFLLEAALDTGSPRSLLFNFEKIQPAAGAPSISIASQAVLIPSNVDPSLLDQQLATLQRELSAIAKTAKVHIA